MAWPTSLTATELQELHDRVGASGGDGFVWLHLPATGQLIVVVVGDGAPLSWVLVPCAGDEQAAARLAQDLCAGLSYSIGLAARRGELAARAAIDQAALH